MKFTIQLIAYIPAYSLLRYDLSRGPLHDR